MLENEQICLEAIIPEGYIGLRLDSALAKCFPEHSRSRITQWIRLEQVRVNGEIWEPKRKIQGGEQIEIHATRFPVLENCGEEIPLSIVYEDEDILIINKPAGLVVHPGAGNPQGTLLNALLHHAPQLSHLPRAGIIHRLDKDTTGLMVVTKTLEAHTFLVAALSRREIAREYLALVGSEIIAGKTLDHPIGRHPQQRIKMAVLDSGKPAVTHYRCQKRYQGFTLLHVKLETGRTHQIRVHLSHEGHPLVGDTTYGWRHRVPPKSTEALKIAIMNFQRQALHAWRLSLTHPRTGEKHTWDVPLPADFLELISHLNPL
jgi:23S rRNA pseudouridine1911/1915/1917 synthase